MREGGRKKAGSFDEDVVGEPRCGAAQLGRVNQSTICCHSRDNRILVRLLSLDVLSCFQRVPKEFTTTQMNLSGPTSIVSGVAKDEVKTFKKIITTRLGENCIERPTTIQQIFLSLLWLCYCHFFSERSKVPKHASWHD